MARNTESASIASHTEYARTRFRCLECGEYVLGGDEGARRCIDCRESPVS